jgi:hypothetical protein
MKAGAMIEIDVEGLPLEKDDGILGDNHTAFVYRNIIPLERFVRVSVSTDKKPCFFHPIKFRGD